MENITFELANSYQYGPAYFDYLGLRKRFFVDQLKWDIAHNEKYEMDQYDNPLAHYSLVLKNGRVVGGARAMPTTSMWGQHSYMLKDSYRGMLPGIPPDVLGKDITQPDVWELTRIVISDEIDTHEERSECLAQIMDGLVSIVRSQGGDEMLGLSPPTLVRALRKLGFPCHKYRDPYRCEDDGRKYAVLAMSAKTAQVERVKFKSPKIPKAVFRSEPSPQYA